MNKVPDEIDWYESSGLALNPVLVPCLSQLKTLNYQLGSCTITKSAKPYR